MSHSPLWFLSLSQLQFTLDGVPRECTRDEPNLITLALNHTFRGSEGKNACKHMCIPMLCVQSAHAENQTDADLNTRTSSEGGAPILTDCTMPTVINERAL